MIDLYSLSVRYCRGVGPAKEEALQHLNIYTVADLLEYFPYRYEDYRVGDLASASDGDRLTLHATVQSIPVVQRYGRKTRMSCRVLISDHIVTAVWFNQAYLKERLQINVPVTITGKWDARRKQITVSRTEFSKTSSSIAGTVQPVYSVGGSITQNWLNRTIRQALEQYGEHITELIPEHILQKRRLLPRKDAIAIVHYPPSLKKGQEARNRIVYEEFFLFQIKLHALRSLSRNRHDGIARQFENATVRRFVRSLPFELTPSQKQVILEIFADLRSDFAMNRLLQGDVGSGKTVVAAIALYANYLSGYQGALMVPTELLAEQHYRFLSNIFAPFDMEISLLTGSLTERQKRDVLASLQSGLTDIVVGTHALIQDAVYFANLGLVVTDEQHRFGVQQRGLLRKKGIQADVLMMTATPIPRTLAITAFGDMDVSTLRELPKGRKRVKTTWVKSDKLDQVIQFIERELEKGRQAYVICPLIEESEKLDVQNAVDLHAQLQMAMPSRQVALLHGRMLNEEKEQTMERFRNHEVHVLVSTTVIEVGVDVPNATVMVVYDADRFGLSQLHQLRGRVGRGSHQSYCILVADPKTKQGVERLRVMTETDDGFEIARKDLELRGPGDFFGTKQSGLPEFRMADMIADYEWLEMARDDAAQLVAQTDFWTSAAYLPLRNYLQREGILDETLLD